MSRRRRSSSSPDGIARHALFFGDGRRAMVAFVDGSFEIVDTWDMTTCCVVLPQHPTARSMDEMSENMGGMGGMGGMPGMGGDESSAPDDVD